MKNPFLPVDLTAKDSHTTVKQQHDADRMKRDRIDAIRNAAFELYKHFDVGTRETALATTKLEESVMWAVKGVSNS